MPNVTANGIQIEYDTFGDKSSPTILLIIGIGTQLIAWDEPLCKKLADSGLYVIRFDNRDVGLSTKIEEAGIPDINGAIGNLMMGKQIDAPYSLDDMADDAVGLLDALGIEKAHICGMSMGAAIAQTVAIRHPKRLLSLMPVYGTTGNPELPQAKPEAMQALIGPPPETPEEGIDRFMDTFKIFTGPGFPFDEEWHLEFAKKTVNRSFYPVGLGRQMLAIMAHGNRKPALAAVSVPTFVFHGSEDPIVPVEGGKDTAEAVPGAELMIIEGMGHDMPKLGGAWDQITDKMIEFTNKIVS